MQVPTYSPKNLGLENESVINRMMIDSFSLKSPGLLNGRMGYTIVFYLWGREKNKPIYEEFGERLLDTVIQGLTTQLPINFSNGLCGIGWGLEFLFYHRFVEFSSNDIFEELDQRIIQLVYLKQNLNFQTELVGILHYVLARINGNNNRKEKKPFTKEFLQYLQQHICLQNDSIPDKELSHLMRIYNHWFTTEEINYSIETTLLIKTLQIFNFKIDK